MMETMAAFNPISTATAFAAGPLGTDMFTSIEAMQGSPVYAGNNGHARKSESSARSGKCHKAQNTSKSLSERVSRVAACTG